MEQVAANDTTNNLIGESVEITWDFGLETRASTGEVINVGRTNFGDPVLLVAVRGSTIVAPDVEYNFRTPSGQIEICLYPNSRRTLGASLSETERARMVALGGFEAHTVVEP